MTWFVRAAQFDFCSFWILKFFEIRSGRAWRSVDLILLLLCCLFIQLVTVLDDALFNRWYVYHWNLRSILLCTRCWCRIATHAAFSRAKWCRSGLRMISILLYLIASTIELLVLVVREKRNLFSFLTEWTLGLWNLLGCHFIWCRKRILVTLTGRHVLFKDLWWTTWCLLHNKWVLHAQLLVTAPLETLFATSALFIALVSSHIIQLCLHEHFILNVLIFVKNLFITTDARVTLLARLLPTQFFVHLHQTLDRLFSVCHLLAQLFAALGQA